MASGMPYIGSVISLISKAQIRYEGILYTIDPHEATVALAKVKSFGTEDRPTDRPVSPREEIFEYIIFRGNDIKDLNVCEPPCPRGEPPQNCLPPDPAIVKASSCQSNNVPSAAPPLPSNGGPSSVPGYQQFGSGYNHAPSYNQYNPLAPIGAPSQHTAMGQFNHPQANVPPNVPGSRGSTPPSKRKSPVTVHEPAAPQPGTRVNESTNERTTDRPKGSGKPTNTEQQHHRRAPRGGARGGYLGGHHHGEQHHQHEPTNQPYSRQHRETADRPPRNREYRANYDNMQPRGGAAIGRGGAHHPRNSRPPPLRPMTGGPGGRPQNKPKDVLKFEGEFDFESSNAQFDKEKLVEELKKMNLKNSMDGGSNTEKLMNGEERKESPTEGSTGTEEVEEEVVVEDETPESNFYDKSRSFFDNISCEANERAKGIASRPNWREERKMNSETFGVSMSYRKGWRGGRGGGWRGRDGNGGYQGNRGTGGGRGQGYRPSSNRGGRGRSSGGAGRRNQPPSWVDYEYDAAPRKNVNKTVKEPRAA